MKSNVRDDRGQAAVLTVIFLVALLGAVAMVLDVGSWFRAQRSTQSTADASALAAAHELPESPGAANALATEYLGKNGGGVAAVTFSSKLLANDTVTVKVTRKAPGVFSKLFGINSVDVHAKASARAGNPDQARYAAPIAVDIKHPLLQCKPLPCFGSATTLDLEKVGPGAFRLINLDGSKGGTGGKIDAEWILHGYDGYMPLGWYGSDPGAAFNDSKFKSAMTVRIGDELLFPVYDKTTGSGANFSYHVVGWVGFVVTSFTGKGNKGTVAGHFVRVIWEGIQSTSGGAEDFGVRAIELVE
ncbi:MAG TPA: flp pilus-assembly TadE/G-like family protein [Gaiellaceae bacterium]|nr:flp pilus-assembly TadE/G-like family protein [Gaiellaceae bacterium]